MKHVYELIWLIALVLLVICFNYSNGIFFGICLTILILSQAMFSAEIRLEEKRQARDRGNEFFNNMMDLIKK